MKILRALTLALVAAGWLGMASAQALRPEVGKPLQQAGELLRAGKAREALAKVKEAEAVPNRTAAEQLTLDRMKAAAAQRAGDMGTAVVALEAIYGKVGAAEKGPMAEQLASAYAQMRNNAKATEWLNRALQAGQNTATTQQLQSYLLAASGDYAAIGRDAATAVAAAEKAGRRPDEGDLLRLADAQQRTGNLAGYGTTLGKLVAHYPKKDYWSAYLTRLPRKAGFAPRFELDVLRLRLASGTMERTEEYMELAQLALQAGLSAEALRVIEQGYKVGALGTGPEATRHQRLRDLAVKRDAEIRAKLPEVAAEAAAFKEGDALVRVGYTYVTMGQADKGIELIRQGMAKGGLKYPDDAKLRLGMAQLQSPKGKGAAMQTLRSVKADDGAADIARLWTVLGAQ
jgi:tetratricopeptide (TPR) repeat protein